MPGYSGTPLFKKLGYKPGQRVLLVNAPEQYFEWLDIPHQLEIVADTPYDIVHLFTNSRQELEDQIHSLRYGIAQTGSIWVSWYKRASKLPTEITEDIIREVVLPTGLVDVKVCSVSPQWSGLKMMIREELRVRS